MSARRSQKTDNMEVAKLRRELDDLKTQTRASDIGNKHNSYEFDQLSPTEQSAASLGVSPDAWAPIQFLNHGHYKQLVQSNMLSDDLARRIEVRLI